MSDDDVRDLLKMGRYSQALERLLDAYEVKVFRMAFMFVKDATRAEDVTQDVFLKLWRALPAYDGRAAPGTWLYTIARNTCLSASRSDAYRTTLPLDASNEPSAEAGGSHDLEIRQCVDRLPEIQKEIITLFYLQERSVADVGRMLGLPDGTVKSHLHRARIALAAMMKES